jgi:hypothetical protein
MFLRIRERRKDFFGFCINGAAVSSETPGALPSFASQTKLGLRFPNSIRVISLAAVVPLDMR